MTTNVVPMKPNTTHRKHLFEENVPTLDLLPVLIPQDKHRLPALLTAVLSPARKPSALAPVDSSLLEPAQVELTEVRGTISRDPGWNHLKELGSLVITVPIGLDQRLVSVATFKVLARRKEDVLFRKNGERWDIVEDNTLIDLEDRTQVYRLGAVQIIS